MWYRIDYWIIAMGSPILDHHERCHESIACIHGHLSR